MAPCDICMYNFASGVNFYRSCEKPQKSQKLLRTRQNFVLYTSTEEEYFTNLDLYGLTPLKIFSP